MFTKNQIEEIRDKLAQLGVKNKIILLKDLLSEATNTIIIE